MNLDIRLDNEVLKLVAGIPPSLSPFALPETDSWQAAGPWGVLTIQEIKTEKYILRHFLFLLQKALSFQVKEKNEGVQSLFVLRGQVEYKATHLKEIKLREKEFALFNACEQEATSTIIGGRLCSILNAYYSPRSYQEFLPFFPQFEKDLQKTGEPFHFLYPPKPARFTVHDSILAIWFDKYVKSLQKKHIELRLETTLFTLLAQTYERSSIHSATIIEQELAAKAKDLILQDLSRHYTIEQISLHVNYSPAYIKRIFVKVYGVGLFQYLRRARMEYARELLLKGEALKYVALEVGMNPSNFPKEFKAFFGYTVSELKKGFGL